MSFHLKLIELPIVKATEFERRAAEHPNQCELCGDDIDDEAEPRLLDECDATFGFACTFRQRLPAKSRSEFRVLRV